MSPLWSYVLSAIGIAGFVLAGSKVWWAWYLNIANQFLWTAYAVLSEQWGFLIASGFYLWVFTRNAVLWTSEHREEVRDGHVTSGDARSPAAHQGSPGLSHP